MRSPDKTKTFVVNHIAAIGELTDLNAWRHVPTNANPADLASRDMETRQVKDSVL